MSSAGVQLMGPSGTAVWSSPTFDAAKGMLYVTTGDNYSDPPTGMSDAILSPGGVSPHAHQCLLVTARSLYIAAVYGYAWRSMLLGVAG